MMNTNEPKESRMLTEVRRWRRETYEERRCARDPEERKRQAEELLREFGLKPPKRGRKPAA